MVVAMLLGICIPICVLIHKRLIVMKEQFPFGHPLGAIAKPMDCKWPMINFIRWRLPCSQKCLPEEEFGPGINFREYSFLDNPLLPKQVKESWLEVQLCKHESEDCHASNDTVLSGVLKFPKGSNEEKLLLAYISKPRYEGPEVDRALAEKVGEKKLMGTDEEKFIKILCAEPWHLASSPRLHSSRVIDHVNLHS